MQLECTSMNLIAHAPCPGPRWLSHSSSSHLACDEVPGLSPEVPGLCLCHIPLPAPSRLSSDNEDDDIQIIEHTYRHPQENASPNKRKRERSRSKSITPPPELPAQQRANAMNLVRFAARHLITTIAFVYVAILDKHSQSNFAPPRPPSWMTRPTR